MPGQHGTASDEWIADQQNRVKQQAELVPSFAPSVGGSFGGGYASLGEYYDRRTKRGRYCPDPAHCRAQVSVIVKNARPA